VAVSEASELFSSPSKRLAPYRTIQDRMLLAAHSQTVMKNAPTAPPTPILQRVSTPEDLAPFTVTHSAYADYSPSTCVDTLELSTAPISPTPIRKVYRAGKKTRSVTQIILKDFVLLQGLIPRHILRRLAWPCPLLNYDSFILKL
jgi:hypothetical protein